MISLEQVLAETQKNNRICPQPQKWQELYELLRVTSGEKAQRGWLGTILTTHFGSMVGYTSDVKNASSS